MTLLSPAAGLTLNHQVFIRLTSAGVRALAAHSNAYLPPDQQVAPDQLSALHASSLDGDELEIQLHALLNAFADAWSEPGPLWLTSARPERPTVSPSAPVTVHLTDLGRDRLAAQGVDVNPGPVTFALHDLSRLIGSALYPGARNVIDIAVGIDVGGAVFTPGDRVNVPLEDTGVLTGSNRYVNLAGDSAWLILPAALLPDAAPGRLTVPMTVDHQHADDVVLRAADGSLHTVRAWRLRSALDTWMSA
ncbi:hypothetical protein [Deinococcus soli (ex Cha et al. 2016)]|uniref:Uncharacterized protein n=2 Tax=Deinococcus soli (ex Cha et al. 2016) TaxID=1309411 RepID=A0AAE3XG03_9DEIO|nr:hypothetical protein [Deinococcus soli (ex Cha et al. 2016)]MDR6219028.1 hypothetical protein [Deinococcus soli (ex Cha et al. 2016)]MDR6328825.1 hypothetical protein [Deinococcus soli (ex Cha et al. 2016)]MDR6751687.1 hypothetical protein [Deinococcus soli (ex Cha et al. 2016)]